MKDMLDNLMEVMEHAFDPHWREAWTRRQVEDSLIAGQSYAILVDEHGLLPPDGAGAAGFVLARRAPGEEELLLIAVRPQFRGRGLGFRLLERFAESARGAGADRIFLEMRANNPAANLYERAGFHPIGRRRAYYRTLGNETIDAITYVKNL